MTMYKVTISCDECPEDPLTWVDNGMIFACEHGRYNLGNMKTSEFLDSIGYDGDKYDLNAIVEYLKPKGYVDVLSMTDHSCLSVYRGRPSDPWDSGYIGVVFIPADIAARYDDIESWIDGMLETYTSYINGDVYDYIIERYTSEGMEYVDGCGGNYDLLSLKNDIQAYLDTLDDCTGVEWD